MPTTGPDELRSSIDQLTNATEKLRTSIDMRPNPALDEFMKLGTDTPKAPPADIRHNPALDEVFGVNTTPDLPTKDLGTAYQRFSQPRTAQDDRARIEQHGKALGDNAPEVQTPQLINALKLLTEEIKKAGDGKGGKQPAAESQGGQPTQQQGVQGLVQAYRGLTGAGRSIGGLTRSGNIGGAAEGLASAGRGLGAAEAAGGGAGAAGAMALPVLGVIAAGVAAWEFKKAMDEATRTTIQHYRQLAEVSGVMAAVMAQRDVRDMMRERSTGDRLAGVAQALTNAEQDRADASQELEIAWEEL